MYKKPPSVATKFLWSLPWLARYPWWRAGEVARRVSEPAGPSHLILLVANHFEPGLGKDARARLAHWGKMARATAALARDHDDTPFRHTYFYPAEQYERPLLEMVAEFQSEGLGEVEIHLHHGVEQPDTPENTRRALETFRDVLAEEHRCLSRQDGEGPPLYAFVHGNWALANSAGGNFCGVDSEMQILAETGCYADFTLPSAPDRSQVPRINAIYQCGHKLSEARPHRSGANLKVGDKPAWPVMFTGPLVFDWSRRIHGLPVPRLEDGALAANYPLNMERLERWRGARIGIAGRPDWVFIKLYCHGFFDWDQDEMIGEPLRRFVGEAMEAAERGGEFKLHFATAREAYNMAMAAVDGHAGSPGLYRDYRLRQIMQPAPQTESGGERAEQLVTA